MSTIWARVSSTPEEQDATDEYRSRSLQICSARGIGSSPRATAMPRPVVPFDTPIESCTSQATVLPRRLAFSTMRGRPMSSGWSSALIAVPITRRALSAVPFRSFRAKTVACGVMTPSHPPDHTIGIVATSASLRLPCLSSTRRKAWSASRRVKSLTPPLPSVLPTTATTWSAVNWPARMRSSRPEASCTLLSSTFATSTAIVSVSSCGAARSERSGRDPDPVFDGEVDAQDRADLIAAAPVRDGRARVAGDHAALADVGLDVLVAEREVVPARVANLVGEDRRRAMRPLPRLVEEAVGHRQVPASVVAPGNVRERLEPRLVLLHRAAPDDGV